MMKKYAKSITVIFLVLLMAFSAVACNSTPNKVSNEKLKESQQQAADGKIEGSVTFTYHLGGGHNQSDEKAANRFISAFSKKYKNVDVKADYSAITDARISSAEIGDVFYFSEDKAYKYAVTDKALLPLTGYLEPLGIKQADVYSGIYALGLIDGQLYFVARDYNHMALIYNKGAVAEAGLTSSVKPEWTWAEFQQIAEQLCNDEYYAMDLNLTYSPVFTAFFEGYAGREAWCNTSDKKITFIDEDGEILKAVKEAVELARKHYIKIGGVNESDENLSGKSAVFQTVAYPSAQSIAKTYDASGVEWDLINMPLFEVPSFGCGSSGVGVFNRTQNPTAAAALALFFFTSEGQIAFNSGDGGSVPLLASLRDSGFDAWKFPDDPNWSVKNWDAFTFMADTASTPGQVVCRMPADIADQITKQIPTILKNDLSGAGSVEDGFKALEQTCNELWGKLS